MDSKQRDKATNIARTLFALSGSYNAQDFERSLFNQDCFLEWSDSIENDDEGALAMLLNFPDERVRKLIEAENFDAGAWLLPEPVPQLVEWIILYVCM